MKTGIFLLFLRFSASTVFFAYFNLHLFRILAVVFTVVNMENLINGLCVCVTSVAENRWYLIMLSILVNIVLGYIS